MLRFALEENLWIEMKHALARMAHHTLRRVSAHIGIAYEDDSQIAELHLKRAYDKDRPRIEIIVSAVD